MNWQGALTARLLASAPLTALVAQRVNWIDRPQGASRPAVTLQTVSEERAQHMGGFAGLNASTVQIDAWGDTYAQVRQVIDAVIAALVPEQTVNGIRFTRAFVDQIRDLGERTETAFIHRSSLDLTLHHSTA